MIYAVGDTHFDINAICDIVKEKKEGIFVLPEASIGSHDFDELAAMTKDGRTTIVSGTTLGIGRQRVYLIANGRCNIFCGLEQVHKIPCGLKEISAQIRVCSTLFDADFENVDVILHSSSLDLDELVYLESGFPGLENLKESGAIIASASYHYPKIAQAKNLFHLGTRECFVFGEYRIKITAYQE
jgi:hypothetical protein